MGLYDYSFKVSDEREVSRAQAYDIDASYKDLANVFAAIKGKEVKEAKKVLEECIAMKKAIPYKKFNKHMGHRSELNGRKGRYPKKEAKIALVLLRSAESNANFKGLDVSGLIVRQAAAYKQNVMRRYRQHFGSSITLGYGKQALFANYVTCRAEIVLAKGRKNLKEKIKAEKGKEEKGKGGKGDQLNAQRSEVKAIESAKKEDHKADVHTVKEEHKNEEHGKKEEHKTGEHHANAEHKMNEGKHTEDAKKHENMQHGTGHAQDAKMNENKQG